MFVRKKGNPNGLFSIQVVDKSAGSYRVIKNFGVAKTLSQQEEFINKAQLWIREKKGALELDLYSDVLQANNFLDSIKSLRREGLELVLGKLFDEIGFNKIKDPIFKQLVLYRLVYPSSKLKTTEFLYRYQAID